MLNSGREGAEFPTALRVMAQAAVERLKPFGKSITEAVDHYVVFLEASAKSCTAQQLVRELVAAKRADGASARHVSDLRSRLGIFVKKFDGQMVATITTRQIDDWLRALPVLPQTRNTFRQRVVLAFSFAVHQGYATANPATGAAKAKVVSGSPGILGVNETVRLLETAARQLLPYLAIGAFAGLRRAEQERLDWSEIDFDSGLIEIKAGKAKTAQRRFVTIQPNLREWLLPFRKLRGNVTPQDRFEFRQLFEQARKDAGIAEWPDNGLRHSFASYHLAHFKNAAATALELGHHDSRITFAHYLELVKPKEAERYWSIKPAAASTKVVPLVAR